MYRLPNINAPTDSGKIAQIQDYLFQLVRQMNMGETSSSDTSVAAPLVEEQMDMHSVDVPIEIGTSGIWTYRKWASGLAECWSTTYIDKPVIESDWQVAEENISNWTMTDTIYFPFTFVGIPSVQVSGYQDLPELQGVNGLSYLPIVRVGAISCYAFCFGGSYAGVLKTSYHITGRWK